MWQKVGIIRSGDGLSQAKAQLTQWTEQIELRASGPLAELEAANVCQVSMLMAAAALHRTESRGAHYRTDFPSTSAEWQKHVMVRKSPSGELLVSDRPVDTLDKL